MGYRMQETLIKTFIAFEACRDGTANVQAWLSRIILQHQAPAEHTVTDIDE
jgi:hypothetical protein